MTKKYVYSFNEGSKQMRTLLGGKGADLAEMTIIGLPVPYGFTVTTEACKRYYSDGRTIDDEIIEEIYHKMDELERVSGKKFGGAENPLLVSVRSGSVVSMPGMMDTILNLGLNDETCAALVKLTNNERFVYDSYRRFIQMYGEIVLEIPKLKFEEIIAKQRSVANVLRDVDLSAEDYKSIIKKYKELVLNKTGRKFPEDPIEQLIEAIKAVFSSWNNSRAILYRELNSISEDYGTAVNVQTMVFGNMGETSGTGVAFTRNPSNGERGIYGEFLINAQGEDVVAGIRTPKSINEMVEYFPDVYGDFQRIADVLEKHYKDMQDMEFTIEQGKLYMLQTRSAKRTAHAAVKVAYDMVCEDLISKEDALDRIDLKQIDKLLHPVFEKDAENEATILAKGLPASPGAASGRIRFSATKAEEMACIGENVILVRQETLAEDLAGMVAAEGILTARGGMTSHAAVVARGMGKCCVAGCQHITVDEENKVLTIGDKVLKEGDYISLNGTKGIVYDGKLQTKRATFNEDFVTLLSWADEVRSLKVRTNADNPRDAKVALEFGAEGIGLCRTEHMFFNENRIHAIREMIMSETIEEREAALEKLLPFQRDDFIKIYEVMEDRPVNIRLLDPPLHEFLPQTEEEIMQLSKVSGFSIEKIKKVAEKLHESNPMLGNRGCRLVVTYPEIAKMQTRAIIEAAIHVNKEKDINIVPEIMIPLVGSINELRNVKKTVVDTIEECKKEFESNLEYMIGTMIEVPRAAITADKIAEEAEFFSFGTNDLTQMTLGFSRDDTGKLIKEYIKKGILKDDPFQTIDQDGVGELMKQATSLGKKTRANLKLGICGEHGGDPRSIEFCHRIGLHYVSCSPYRIPVARIASAQAAIRNKGDN